MSKKNYLQSEIEESEDTLTLQLQAVTVNEPQVAKPTMTSTDRGFLWLNESPAIKKMTKPTVHDVAAYVLQKCGSMTAMKLQKLVYYCQAWSLVWDESPLFDEEIQAWANGPVVPALYERHKGQFEVSTWRGNSDIFSDTQKETIDGVLAFYADKPSQVLSDLTHQEDPWLKARKGLCVGERGNQVITHASMMEYYSSL